MEKLYNDDVNIWVLTAQMEILQVLLKDGDYFCFDDIIVKIKELPNPEREMIKEVITLCKLILVNPATSAAGERFFSTARRLKAWLPSRMNQERFSNLTVLKCPYDQIFDIHYFTFSHTVGLLRIACQILIYYEE